MKKLNTRIVSFGKYLPSRVVTNKELESLMDTSDEWIQQRSGIKERRWGTRGEDTCHSMALKASQDAIENAKIDVNEIDAIIFTALMSDYVFPGTGCLLQQSLGFKKNIPALDIRNQCTGFLYALDVADAWIKSSRYKKILIVASEFHSTRLDKTPKGRDVSVLFGDGAGACIVEATEKDEGLLDIQIYSQGAGSEALCLKQPGYNFYLREEWADPEQRELWPRMEGKLVFKNAVERMTQSMNFILNKNSFKNADVDFVVAHQANMRINAMVLEQLKIPWEKTHHTIDRYGNTTAATIPLTFGEAVELKKVKRGDLVALTAFGAGFTWGSALLKF